MWKFRFWLAVARVYNKLAGATLSIVRFFVERSKHGTAKYDEYYSKYVESQKNKHEYLK